MNLKINAFGVALMAVIAFSAMAAPGASATAKQFRAEQLATLEGEDIVTTEYEFPGTGVTTCKGKYTGTSGTGQTETTIIPHYTECKHGGVHSIVHMNGCDYVFTLHTGTTSTGGATTHTHGPMHIVCPAGQEITKTITVFGFSVCTIHIPPQTPTSPTVDYKNTGSGSTRDIDVTFTVSGITAVTTNTGGGCTAGVHHNGKLRGSFTLRAYKHGSSHTEANRVGIWEE